MKKEIILKILSYAIRAPSTHNSQPWLFKLKSDGVSVFLNEKLKLPEADKDSRDLYISIGCMLENMRIAANYFSFEVIEEIIIEENHIADIYFKISNKVENELFNKIMTRVNARGLFNKEKVPLEIMDKLKSFKEDGINTTYVTKKEDITKIAWLTQKAIFQIYKNSSFRKEMSKWMNSNISNKKEGLPGYSLKMPLILSLIIPILIRYFNMGKIFGKLNFKSINSAPMITVLSSSVNNPNGWIKVGKLSERLMLYIQSQGLQTSIYVGSIEIGELYKDVINMLELKERPQFLFAVGHIPGKHKITPRHLLDYKILK